MTNPHKGDVSFDVAGKSYTLRYSHSALVKLENILGKGLMKVMVEITRPEEMRVGTVAALLWAGLQKHHPTMSLDQVIDLLDEIEPITVETEDGPQLRGGAAAAMVPVEEAFAKAFNAPGTKGTNPQPSAGNGTGIVSSSTMPVSATTRTPSGN